jgi:hypothetical protein
VQLQAETERKLQDEIERIDHRTAAQCEEQRLFLAARERSLDKQIMEVTLRTVAQCQNERRLQAETERKLQEETRGKDSPDETQPLEGLQLPTEPKSALEKQLHRSCSCASGDKLYFMNDSSVTDRGNIQNSLTVVNDH